MKILLFFAFFVFTLNSFGQTNEQLAIKGSGDTASSYINYEQGFSLTTPLNSKPDEGFKTRSGFISAYSCAGCADQSYFALTKVLPLNAPLADVVKAFQTKSLQENAANTLLKDFREESNGTILSTKYVEYNGRPAIRIDFNFTKNDLTYHGAAVEVFIEEKKIMTVFSFLSASPEPDAWFKACEDALRSIVVSKAFNNKTAARRNSNSNRES